MAIRLNKKSDFKEIPRDDRQKRIDSALLRYAKRPDALIEILHIVQESYGFIPLSLMATIARRLKLPASRIYGVVTFYHFFSTTPKGEHTCVVCTGTACHVKGSKEILDKVQKTYAVRSGETTPDGKLGLQTARCLGCCSLGPAVVIDDQIVPKSDAQKVIALIRERMGQKP